MEELRDLVFQMGLCLKDMDNIIERYSGDMQRVHLIQKWLDLNPDACWDKLVAALRKINKKSLASEIESEHLSRPPLIATPAPVGSLLPAPLTVRVHMISCWFGRAWALLGPTVATPLRDL